MLVDWSPVVPKILVIVSKMFSSSTYVTFSILFLFWEGGYPPVIKQLN